METIFHFQLSESLTHLLSLSPRTLFPSLSLRTFYPRTPNSSKFSPAQQIWNWKLIFGVQVFRLLSPFQIRLNGSHSTSKRQFYKLESSIWFVSFVLPVLIYVCFGYVPNCVTFYVSCSFNMIFEVLRIKALSDSTLCQIILSIGLYSLILLIFLFIFSFDSILNSNWFFMQ